MYTVKMVFIVSSTCSSAGSRSRESESIRAWKSSVTSKDIFSKDTILTQVENKTHHRANTGYVGRFAKIGFANGGANARITDDCELVRIANYQYRAPAQRYRYAGGLLFRRSEQLAAKWGANVRI